VLLSRALPAAGHLSSGGLPPVPSSARSIGNPPRLQPTNRNVASVALPANDVKGVASLYAATYAFVVPDNWLSTGEAAERLGVHRSTLVRYIEEGKLPARRLPGGHFRIKREDLEKLLEQGELQEPGQAD
jgi:excisionase family DNA binding protein